MVSRYTGAILGLLAFMICCVSGIIVRNPADVTLSRAISSLFLFCIIGLVVGAAAQYVLNDYARRKYAELMAEPPAASENPEGEVPEGDKQPVQDDNPSEAKMKSTPDDSQPM